MSFPFANEFIQNAETLSGQQPLLPRSLEVPGVGSQMETGTGSKRNSISDPERNEQDVEEAGEVDTSVAGTERVPDVSVLPLTVHREL